MRTDAGHRWLLRPSCGALLPFACVAAIAVGLAPRLPGRPPCAPSRPDLVFAAEALDAGGLTAGETRVVSIGWRRVGPGMLEVLGVLPRCGCALVEPLPPRLEAGATGTLKVRLAGLRRPGPFCVRVDVVSCPVGGDSVRRRLTLRGYVDVPAVLRPPRLALGRVSAGRVIERHLQLEVAETLAAHAVEAAVEGVEGEAWAVPGLLGPSRGPTLVVRIQTPGAPGPFEARVVARVGAWGPLVAVVSGEVAVPETSAAPMR